MPLFEAGFSDFLLLILFQRFIELRPSFYLFMYRL